MLKSWAFHALEKCVLLALSLYYLRYYDRDIASHLLSSFAVIVLLYDK